jgi:two-component system sensor histidine kinase AlgZ
LDSPSIATPRAELKRWRHTLEELSRPRRSGPISAVAFALLCTEWVATHSGPAVIALGLFVAAFMLVVPALYRETSRGGVWMPLYIVVCTALVASVCFAAPLVAGYESYVAHPPAAVAIGVLVGIAGWVLGRDIDLSDGLAAETSRAEVLKVQAEDARLVALRQQLDPHFLFNTLGAIAEWCREDPLVAERALLELSSMLRTLFDGVREAWWPLERELELLRALQHLYAVRDEERFAVRFSVEEDVAISVPPLIFLGIFENALTHGSGDVPTAFSVKRSRESLELSLWNAGEYAGPREGGTGVDTTRRRLHLAYGEAASLEVGGETIGGIAGTRALMRIPTGSTVDSAS